MEFGLLNWYVGFVEMIWMCFLGSLCFLFDRIYDFIVVDLGSLD